MTAIKDEISLAQYSEAFASIKRARNVLGFVIAFAIVVQIASFIVVYFSGVIDATQQLPRAELNETSSVTQAWMELLRFAMSATMFLTPILAALLMLTFMFAVKIVLMGQLGGLGEMLSSFYWSLFLLALLMPWQKMFNSPFVCGMAADLEELIRWTSLNKRSWLGRNPPLWGQIAYFARFLAFPILTLMVWIVTQLKFGRGFAKLFRQVQEDVDLQTNEPVQPLQQDQSDLQQ